MIAFIVSVPYFIKTYFQYKKRRIKTSLKIKSFFPVYSDRFYEAGEAKGHYFYQDLWAARKIFNVRPKRHIDIGSSVIGFVSHLLVFMDVEVIDIRDLTSDVEGLTFIQSDATLLERFEDNSIDSISTLHACEHFGLGRYGDTVDPEAWIKFIQSLIRVLKPGGRLYFSVPIGKEQVVFNAHRIFSPISIMDQFTELTLVSFSGVKDDQRYYENISLNEMVFETYGCGLFEFTKE